MRVFGRGELGGDWTRYRPCDPALRLNCNPTLFPLLKPEIQFGVQVQGTVSDRLHIDVDYDQRREFDAANNIKRVLPGTRGRSSPARRSRRRRLRAAGLPLPDGGDPGRKLRLQGDGPGRRPGHSGDLGAAEGRCRDARVPTRRRGRGRKGLVQEAQIVLDDADYVRGQFFFLVDPSELTGYPHVNVLALRATDAPPTSRPMAGGAGIQVYRDERPSLTNPEQQAQLGYFLAEAVSGDGTLRHSGRFRRPGAGRGLPGAPERAMVHAAFAAPCRRGDRRRLRDRGGHAGRHARRRAGAGRHHADAPADPRPEHDPSARPADLAVRAAPGLPSRCLVERGAGKCRADDLVGRAVGRRDVPRSPRPLSFFPQALRPRRGRALRAYRRRPDLPARP